MFRYIEDKDVFEWIISGPAPPLQAPFVFSSTLVEKKDSSSQSVYGLEQGHTNTISYIIQLHQVHKNPGPRFPTQVFFNTVTTTEQDHIYQTVTTITTNT